MGFLKIKCKFSYKIMSFLTKKKRYNIKMMLQDSICSKMRFFSIWTMGNYTFILIFSYLKFTRLMISEIYKSSDNKVNYF